MSESDPYWEMIIADTPNCEICEEAFKYGDEIAEMALDGVDSVICHAQCGISKGLEVA